jgi:hypothetical protein
MALNLLFWNVLGTVELPAAVLLKKANSMSSRELRAHGQWPTCHGELGSAATQQGGPSQPVDSPTLVAAKLVLIIHSADEQLP